MKTHLRSSSIIAALLIGASLIGFTPGVNGQVPPPLTGDLDHLTCYKIKDPLKLRDLGVDGHPRASVRHLPFFDDPNTPNDDVLSQDCKFTKSAMLCARSTKKACTGGDRDGKACQAAADCPNGGTCDDGRDDFGQALENDLVCYKVRCAGTLPPKAGAEDQFGRRPIEGVEPTRVGFVCAPVVTFKPSCGNGAVDTGEDCDPGAPDAAPPIPPVGGPDCSANDCQEDCTCTLSFCNELPTQIGGTSGNDGGRCRMLSGTPPAPCDTVPCCDDGSSLEIPCTDDCDCALSGTPGDDVINGRGGDDVICGLGGADTICGGAGRDVIYGGEGTDDIFGDTGNDTICGEGGIDELFGDAGDDILFGGDDGDTIIKGGVGNNVICAGDGADNVPDAGDGDDVVCGEDCNMAPCSLTVPSNFACVCVDDVASDTMIGGDGGDIMYGCAGNDTLAGDKGSDTLIGGDGTDVCDGGRPEMDNVCDSTCESTPQCP